jgi:cell division septal protein FtsQ
VKVKAPAEKNFRRPKGKPGRARKSRARTGWRLARQLAALGLFLYAGYRAVNLVVSASPLQVGRIVVAGNARLSSAEVEALARGLYGRSILTANLDAARRRLLESPWIADATLRRVLPSTIEIQVVERRPMGISRLGSRLYLMDRTGTVIDEFGPRYREFDLPIIDGLVRSPKSGKPAIDETRAGLAARVIDAVAPRRAIARRLSQIDVSDPHDVTVLLDGDPALLRLGEERFLERLQAYVEVAGALRERVPEIDYIDLRFDDRVFVKPRGASGTIEAGRKAPKPRTTF